MALRSQVVHLAGLDLMDQLHETRRVGEVAVVQLEVLSLLVGQRVLVQMPDPGRVEGARATDDAVHLVTLRQQQLGQVRAVLMSERAGGDGDGEVRQGEGAEVVTETGARLEAAENWRIRDGCSRARSIE